MPNHVKNELSFEGIDIHQVIGRIGSDLDLEYPRYIDFEKILPMPKSLDIVAGSTGDLGVRIITENLTPADLPERERDLYEEAKELGQKYLDNEREHGYTTWYGWAYENWGTKWNAYDQELEDNTITFSTAWCCPIPILSKIAAMFPQATITVRYADEDIGSNCGTLTFKDKMMWAEHPDGEEAINLATELWYGSREEYDMLQNDWAEESRRWKAEQEQKKTK